MFLSLSQEFGPFNLDVCANEVNHKVSAWFGPGGSEPDGLAANWGGSGVRCWMNPPYGRGTKKWVAKAYDHAIHGKAVTCALLPARTDTRWFHEYVWAASVDRVRPWVKTLRFLQGRPKFLIDGKPTGQAGKFPSMVVVFDGS